MQSNVAGFRLSPPQRRLWMNNPESAAAYAQCVISVPADADNLALRRALDSLIAEQEILRTVYVRQAGARLPLQVIHENLAAAWRQEEMRGLTEEAEAARLQSLMAEERRPFDLENGPILRACLVVCDSEPPRIILTLPALSADKQTLEILFRDLAHRYAGKSTAAEPALQYADYSEWQNELRESDEGDAPEGRAFWKQISDSQPSLTLPLGLRPGDATTADYQNQTFILVSGQVAQIEALARRFDAAPGAVLPACFQAVLFRLTGQEDCSLGSIVQGRNYAELEGAYGLFAKTLPLPCRLSGDLSFAQLLHQVRETQTQTERWQDFAPEPPTDNAPDLGIIFAEEAAAPLNVGGFTLLRNAALTEPYRIKLTCFPANSGLHLSFDYDARRFDADAIQRLALNFTTLIDSALANPDAALDALNLLHPETRRQLLETWNQTDAEYPRDACLHTLFERQVARTPDAPALVGADGKYSYRELNAAANRLAHLLRAHGVNQETRVGLLMERSAAMIIGVLGILKAGGAYVPLAPDAPKSRLAYQLGQTNAPIVLTQESLRGLLSEFSSECKGCIVSLDADAPTLAEQPDTNPEPVNQSGDLVCIIYTSGSTGQPKGVENTHRGLVNYATYINGLIGGNGLNKPLGGLQFATVSPLSADLGNTCVFPSLISGGTLHVISYETGMSAAQFSAYVAGHTLDVLKITPSHLNALLGTSGGAGVLPRRFLFLGGEASSWDLIAKIREVSSCRIINHYGPTETTIGSLIYPVPAEPLMTATVPIGRPIANTKIYVLDSRQNPVPIGVPGELYIGGDGVADGYIEQPELTESRFIPNPFTGDGSRMYRTGDVARYLPDGNVEFLGRGDDQVKIRGFRVEPGEVEAVLRTHPGVHQAVVVSREDGGEKRLVGYYVAAASNAPTSEGLKSHLHETLPDYMVPAALIRLPSLPLNANGKVDRAALPAPETLDADASRERMAPRTPVEQQLAQMWAQTLGSSDFGIHDDFFELGGHSLMAIRVMSHVRETFRVEIAMNALFDAPTVAALAEVIVAEQSALTDALMDDLDNLSEEEVEALLAQERQKSL